jgi:endonuclease YncB( thermonuclease family)
MVHIIAALVVIALSQASHATELLGRVVGVADGDTITVLEARKQQHKIRFAGIDAPERKQPFGNRSRQNLSRYVAGKEVRLDCPRLTDTSERFARCGCNPLTVHAAGRRWTQG